MRQVLWALPTGENHYYKGIIVQVIEEGSYKVFWEQETDRKFTFLGPDVQAWTPLKDKDEWELIDDA